MPTLQVAFASRRRSPLRRNSETAGKWPAGREEGSRDAI